MTTKESAAEMMVLSDKESGSLGSAVAVNVQNKDLAHVRSGPPAVAFFMLSASTAAVGAVCLGIGFGMESVNADSVQASVLNSTSHLVTQETIGLFSGGLFSVSMKLLGALISVVSAFGIVRAMFLLKEEASR